MAWRYRQYYVETGDILDPQHWVGNMQEYAEEFNGYLDQDNFRNDCIDSGQLQANVCNQYWTYERCDPDFEFDDTTDNEDVWVPNALTAEWQREDDAGQDLASVQFTTDHECQLSVRFGASWHWNGDALTQIGTGPSVPGSGFYYDNVNIQFRVFVDGSIVSDSGEYPAIFRYGSTWLPGTIPLPAGSHDVWAEARVFLKPKVDNPYKKIRVDLGDPDSVATTDWSDTVAVAICSLICHARYR